MTFFIEAIVIWIFIRGRFKEVILYSFLINLFTWPLANLFYGITFAIYFVEISVVLVESILIMLLLKVKFAKSLLISFLANLASFLIGLSGIYYLPLYLI
jgi:hypothetical protein